MTQSASTRTIGRLSSNANYEIRPRARRLLPSRGVGRSGIAAELGIQLHQVGEDVGLAPQFVGDQRRLTRNRRNDGYPDATTLQRLDQGAEIAVAGEQNHLLDLIGEIFGGRRW